MHLLCSNYWLQPIYQELLHSSSRYNATVTGKKNRPSSGLARISAYPRPPKVTKPSASGTRFTDWIGGAMRIRCRSGFLPIGRPWFFANSSERKMSTELPIPLGWTRPTSMMIFASNGLRLRPIEGCSSRWVTLN